MKKKKRKAKESLSPTLGKRRFDGHDSTSQKLTFQMVCGDSLKRRVSVFVITCTNG